MPASDLLDRISARASSLTIVLGEVQLSALATYCELLEKWNRQINLTALTLEGWPDETLDRLLFEPLSAVPFVQGLAGDWIDLGTGGGSPAVPLALTVTGLHLTMTESRGKKAAFLREVTRVLALPSAKTFEGRFEELMNRAPRSVELVTARAVNSQHIETLVDRLLSDSGRLLLFARQRVPAVGQLRSVGSQALPGGSSFLSILSRWDSVPRGTSVH